MSGPWPTVRLGDVLTRSQESVTLNPDQQYREITVRLWGKGVVQRGAVLGVDVAARRRFVARQSQFILSRIDARNGALGIVPPELDGAIVTNDFPLFSIDEQRLLPAYLGWVCKTAGFVEQCRRASEGTTNRVRLQEVKFMEQEIPLPPLAEQRRVVARIEELTDRIADAQGLRKHAALEADGLWWGTLARQYAPLMSSLDSLDSVCDAIIDNLHSTPRYDGDTYPCIRSQDVGWGTINFASALRTSAAEFRERTSRGEPIAGDVVFVREGDVGRCAVVDGSRKFSLGQRVMLFRPSSRLLPRFLMFQLMSQPVLEAQILKAKTGTTSHHVNIRALRSVLLSVPDLPEQRRVLNGLDTLQPAIQSLKQLQADSAAEFDALLPAVLDRAFRGELL